MKKHVVTSLLYTLVTGVLLGILYPLVITGIAKLTFPDKAEGQLLVQDGKIAGSRLIGQPFSGPGFFHSRPSAAGSGYDAGSSSGSNLGPTNSALVQRVAASVAAETTGSPPPNDLVTASASGLDPDISPAAATYQVHRVAQDCGMSEDEVRNLVRGHIVTRQFGLLGEARVNVLELNMALAEQSTTHPLVGATQSHCGK